MTWAVGRSRVLGGTSSRHAGAPAPSAPRDGERPPDRLIGVAGIAVLVAVSIAQAGDLITFIQMISLRGPGAEVNPLVGHILTALGLPALILLKVGLVALVVLTFAIVVRRHQWVAAFVATLATVVGVAGAASNILAIG